MDINKAKEVTKVIKQIQKCENILNDLERGYRDEFEIYYNGLKRCELEEEALNLIIEHYKQKLKEAQEKLESL